MSLGITDIASNKLLDKTELRYRAFSDIAGYDGTTFTKKIKYYIHDQTSNVDYEFYDDTFCDQSAYSLSEDEEKYIIDTFDVIDNLIDLDFERVYSADLATVDIYKTNIYNWGGYHKSRYGRTSGEYYYRSEIIFEDANTPGYLENYPTLLERLAQRIVHEIAHFVGLKHGSPYMDPNDSRYTTEDTRMSYNYDAGHLNTPSFSSLDIEALQAIWGVELGAGPQSISLSSSDFNENIPANSSIATLSTSNPDSNETNTYSFVNGTGDTDNNLFSIDGSSLKIKSSPDYETKSSYSIRLKTTDSVGLSFEKVFTLSVNDLDENLGTSSNDLFLDDPTEDDHFDGLAGIDTVKYDRDFSYYSFDRTSESLQITAPFKYVYLQPLLGGTDTLKNIEYIQFSDQTVEESKVDIIKTYSGNFSDYKFYNKGNGVYQIKTDTGYDDITGLPLLTFTGESTTSSFRDISAILDIKGTFDQVTGLNTDDAKMFRLYNAAFKRLPDSDGLKYWIGKYTSGENDDRAVASSFLVSAEFKQRYGEDVTNAKYVETLYVNVLGRDYDQSGYNYWLGNLNNGLETRYELLLGFAESTENKALFTEMTGFG